MPPTDDQKKTITTIVIKLAQLGHEVSWQEPITTGPIVTTFRFQPKAAVKVAQICSLAADLAMALSVDDVVVRRLPGEAVIGVTVPNASRTVVNWRDTLAYPDATWPLPLNFGVDSHGTLFRDDLTQLPHLLIAGATGSGKSTLLSSIIASLVYWRSPEQVQIVLSDTKQVEFGHFIGVPHLMFEPTTTKYQTWEKMDWLIEETERRLQVMAKSGCKNIHEYNAHSSNFGSPNRADQNAYYKGLPYIVFVIDELFDVLGGEARGESKIAQSKLQLIVGRSRASGIHVIAATQRSSVDVVKGTTKSNFPARISFRLPSEVDSRTILGASGAEHLIARGDMWYVSPSRPAMLRLHSAYATIDDIKQCCYAATLKESYVRNSV